MTRGRKKNLSIPPTRALVQQRDYRARRAHYVASLEEKCRKLEEENVQLREELVEARSTRGIPQNTQTVEASQELIQHLSLTAASLSRFQQLVFAGQNGPLTSCGAGVIPTESTLPSSSRASPPSEHGSTPTSSPIEHGDSEGPGYPGRNISPECCGGILDCGDLIEPENDGPPLIARTSELRSTSS